MRIVISGGGTGGHIYPALAIAEELERVRPETEIIFVGSKKGMENGILAKYSYKVYQIGVSGFDRKLGFDTLFSAKNAVKGLQEAFNLIKKLKPDAVIGTGGYVCGPVVLAAALSGIKTCIQEQNAVPGVTNKILSRFAKRIYLGSPGAQDFLPKSKAIVLSGNPVRKDILSTDRLEGLSALQLDGGKLTVLISGGSRGAMSMNHAMLYVNDKLAGRADVQIVHITGKSGHGIVLEGLSVKAKKADNIKITPYLDDMPLALAVADLAVFRAGALGLAELAARGVPSILVPYPYAAANHQEHNARAFEKEGAAIVVRDKELTGEGLLGLIEILLADRQRLQQMADCAKKLGRPNAAEDIVADIIEMIEKK